MTRGYDMSLRSRLADETRDRILEATERLLAHEPIGSVTLAAIADEAGVSVQTVLRHTGSRSGCFELVAERVRERIHEQRGGTEPGDVDGALEGLLLHYEVEGTLVLSLLAQEKVDPTAGEAVREGRAYHRAWVERHLGPCLAEGGRETIDALVAATDIYVWKLLRLDLGRSKADARRVMHRLVTSILEAP